MDKFLLPSLYEGLPIVLIEAQAMGIECYVSSNVSVETDMKAGIYKSISLDKGASEWADIIMKDTIVDDIDRGKYVDFVRKQGFDLQDFSFMEVLN
jgi:glycosyltransferase EpsF